MIGSRDSVTMCVYIPGCRRVLVTLLVVMMAGIRSTVSETIAPSQEVITNSDNVNSSRVVRVLEESYFTADVNTEVPITIDTLLTSSSLNLNSNSPTSSSFDDNSDGSAFVPASASFDTSIRPSIVSLVSDPFVTLSLSEINSVSNTPFMEAQSLSQISPSKTLQVDENSFSTTLFMESVATLIPVESNPLKTALLTSSLYDFNDSSAQIVTDKESKDIILSSPLPTLQSSFNILTTSLFDASVAMATQTPDLLTLEVLADSSVQKGSPLLTSSLTLIDINPTLSGLITSNPPDNQIVTMVTENQIQSDNIFENSQGMIYYFL